MSGSKTGCLRPDELSRLLDSALSDAELTVARDHLIRCENCRQVLDQLTDQPELRCDQPTVAENTRTTDDHSGMAILLSTLKSDRWRRHHALRLSGALAEGLPAEAGCLPVAGWQPGEYQIRREIGRGGMGVVYLAYDQQLSRVVALKVLRSDRSDEQYRMRFVREGQAAARLRHPNVVAVHAAHNPADGPAYLIMEYIDGPTLRALIESERRIIPTEAAELLRQIANGVQHAHSAGLIHRDLKPGNILVQLAESDGGHGLRKALVMDFGLVRVTDADARQSTGEGIAGTPAYMSPEQVESLGELDHRTDIYSLGVTFYEMLTGSVPFVGATPMVLRQIMEADPRPPRRLNDAIPRDLETICLKAMAREPGRRYQTAAALAADLERWQCGEPIQARPVGVPERMIKWCRRSPVVAGLTVSTFLLLLIVAIGSTAAALVISFQKSLSDQLRNQAWTAKANAVEAATAARQSQADAERSAQSAVDAYNHLVFSVQKDLSGRAGTLQLRRQILEKAIPGLQQIAAASESSGIVNHSLLSALLRHGEVVWYLGRTDEAVGLYQKCRELAERQLAEQPVATAVRVDLALALEQLGVIAQHSGNSSEAEQNYQRSLAELESALAANSTSVDTQRRIAWLNSRLGDIASINANHADARSRFSSSVVIADRLAAASPDDTALLNDRCTFHQRLGWSLDGLQQSSLAEAEYRLALELNAQQAAIEPLNTEVRRRSMLIRDSLGRLLVSRRDFEAAEAEFETARIGLELLWSEDPENAELGYDLSTVLSSLSSSRFGRGDIRSAVTVNRRNSDLLRELSERFPSTIKFRNSAVLTASGVMQMEQRLGEFARAADSCARALKILEQLNSEGHVGHPIFQSALVSLRDLNVAIPLAEQAVADAAFIDQQSPEIAVELWIMRGFALLQRDETEAAAESADKALLLLSEDGQSAGIQLNAIAGIYATAAVHLSAIESDDPENAKRSEQLAVRAIATLSQAATRAPHFASVFVAYPEFNSLRNHPSFRALSGEAN